MPRDSVPVILHYKDSAFTVYSLEEYNALPDSLKGNEAQQYYIDSVYRSMEYVAAPAVASGNEDTADTSFFFFALFVFIVFIAWSIYRAVQQLITEKKAHASVPSIETEESIQQEPTASYLVYKGASLRFSNEEIDKVCRKYNFYYQKLQADQQLLFTDRVRQFIRSKDFYICSAKGYKEMPILISASAIQITFGLKDFLLPHFANIVIHPEEYFAYDPFRVLVGNVQGQSISLSWKHFLHDYQHPHDGKNVGLHEMAHALQVQYLFSKTKRSNSFKEDYAHYDRIDDAVLSAERSSSNRLFDDNALRNSNEFWATAVELFFEKPSELRAQYPDLYKSMHLVLNQDPASM
nr:zinc-dependent peptidase [uncultured Lacibacter sp.]